MTLGSPYKKILEGIPVGIFVFDGKFRVRFTNEAFRKNFGVQKTATTLKKMFACPEKKDCGKGDACAYCDLFSVMKKAVQEGGDITETVRREMRKNGRVEEATLRIRVSVIEKGKLYLGLAESNFHSEMERELLTAVQMQRRLLPAGKTMAGVPYSYMYVPCHGLGGDLPDVYEIDGRAYGVLADVSGKGVSGGLLSTFIKAGFDKTEKSIAKALTALNVKFEELNQDEQSYITLACVCIDKGKGELRYSLAGHNAPILLKNSFGINEIELPAPPVSSWMPGYEYEEKTIPIAKGDLLALVTDGVTEAKNTAGELFGIERVESVLIDSPNAESFIGNLKEALTAFCDGGFNDDITALAFDL